MKTLHRCMSAKESSFGARVVKELKDFHMHPKINIYKTNGTGRDTYIDCNNGGFGNTYATRTCQFFSSLPADLSKYTNLNPKFPIYKPNGYGRDSYIYSSCGGFYRYQPTGIFKNTLRLYNPFTRLKKYDYIYYANHFVRPKEHYSQVQQFKLQRSASQRLSRPKSVASSTRKNKNY